MRNTARWITVVAFAVLSAGCRDTAGPRVSGLAPERAAALDGDWTFSVFDLQSGEVTCWMEGGFLALKPLSSGQLTAEVDWQAFSRRFSPEQAIQGRRYPGVHYCESREHGSGALKGNLWHSPYFPHELTGTSTRDSVYLSGSLSKPARRVTLRGFRQGDHIAGEIEISTSSEEGQRWRGRFAATKGPPVREEERHWWKFPAPFIVSPR